MLPATATSLESQPAPPPRAATGRKKGPRRKASRRAVRIKMRQTSTPTTEEIQTGKSREERNILCLCRVYSHTLYSPETILRPMCWN